MLSVCLLVCSDQRRQYWKNLLSKPPYRDGFYESEILRVQKSTMSSLTSYLVVLGVVLFFVVQSTQAMGIFHSIFGKGGGGSSVSEILVAGLVASLLQDDDHHHRCG